MPRRRIGHRMPLVAGAAGSALALAACTAPTPTPTPISTQAGDMAITVTSDAFSEGQTIPERYTCRGAGDFPGISWSGDVGDAAAFAVVVDDPDAPNGTFTHLVVLDLPASTTSLADPLGSEAVAAANSAGDVGWTPPCPPSGEHHYLFTVYALRAPTGLDAGATPDEAHAAIARLTIGEGTLTGLVAAG